MGLRNFIVNLGEGLSFFLIPFIFNKFQSVLVCFLSGNLLTILFLICALCILWADKYCPSKEKFKNIYFKFSFLNKFSCFFWLFVFYYALFDSFISTFLANLNNFYHDAFKLSNYYAGWLISSLIILQFSSIFIGFFGKKIGRILNQIIFNHIILLIVIQLIINLFKFSSGRITVWILNSLIGFCISFLYTYIFTLFSIILPKKQSGVGMGIVFSFDYFLTFIMQLLFGKIQDQTIFYEKGYFWALNFINCNLLIGLFILIVIFIFNHKKNFVLNKREKRLIK